MVQLMSLKKHTAGIRVNMLDNVQTPLKNMNIILTDNKDNNNIVPQ